MLAVRNPSLRLALFALLIVLCTPAQLTGQDSATGSLRGTVLDPTGARVMQASIVVVNTGTGTRYSAISDGEGHFAMELLPPGDYSARVEAQGMSPQVTPQLHVDVGGEAELTFRLKIAGAEESLTVSSAPAMVETKPSAVSTLLDERSINEFPLNSRRFSDLALFSPGVTQDPRGLTSATNGDLSFGGTRGVHNTFLVDGSDYNKAFFAQARGRYRGAVSVLHRSRAGVSGLFKCLRRGARTLRRSSGQRGHEVRLEPLPWHGFLLSARQLVWRVHAIPCIQTAQSPAAGRRHDRRSPQAE
jgi:hypothetical protein